MSASDSRAENPYAGQGSVLLDIGGEIGALVVTMPARMDGVEVEIRPAKHGETAAHHDHHHHYPHVAVVPRPTPAGVVHSLVYGEVTAGRYVLQPLPGGSGTGGSGSGRLEVAVVGGRVTEAVWPAG